MRLLVAAILLGYAAVRFLGGYPPPPPGARRLGRSEWAFLAAASDTLYPAGGPIPPSGSQAGIPGYIDAYLDRVPAHMRLLMRCLFFLVEHASFFLWAPGPRGWRRFSSLEPARRQAVLESWRTSRLFPRRLVFTSLRALLTMGYFGSPEVLRTLGLAPYAIEPRVTEADLLYPPAGRPPSEIRWRESDLEPPAPVTPLALDAPLHPDYAESGP